MADLLAETTAATAKLVLDEETGEMVSKNELKKRTNKRAKKAASEAARKAKESENAKSGANFAPKQTKKLQDGRYAHGS